MADTVLDCGANVGSIANETTAGAVNQPAGTYRSAQTSATEPLASPQTAYPFHNGRRRSVLQILDVPFSGKRPELLMTLSNADNIPIKLAALPAHEHGFARVFNIYKTEQSDLEHVILSVIGNKYYGLFTPWEPAPFDFAGKNDVCNILYQWTGRANDFSHYLTAKTAFAKSTSGLLADNKFSSFTPEISYLQCFNEDDDRLVGMIQSFLWNVLLTKSSL